MTSINAVAATEHRADLQRAAERWRRSAGTSTPNHSSEGQEITLRIASADDHGLIGRLAALDDAPALEGRVLLAVIDGEPVAALSLTDGRVVANPFAETREAVALLRLRREHLEGIRTRRWRALVRPRLALR